MFQSVICNPAALPQHGQKQERGVFLVRRASDKSAVGRLCGEKHLYILLQKWV